LSGQKVTRNLKNDGQQIESRFGTIRTESFRVYYYQHNCIIVVSSGNDAC